MNVGKMHTQPQRSPVARLPRLPEFVDDPMRRLRRFAFPIYCKLLAMRWHSDITVQWASTDGVNLFLNPMAFNWLYASGQDNPEGTTAWVLGHEGWHALNGHPQRLSPDKAPDRKRANMAADHVTNLALEDINMNAGLVYGGQYPLHAPEGLYMDRDYAGMSVEEVYNKLRPETEGGTGGDTGVPVKDPEGAPSPTSGQGANDSDDDGNSSGDARGGSQHDAVTDGGITTGTGGQSKQGDSTDEDAANGSGNATNDQGQDNQESGSSNRDASNYGMQGICGTPESNDLREVTGNEQQSKEEIEQSIKEQNNYIVINQQMNEQAGLSGNTFGRLLEAEQKTPPVDWREHYRNWLNARAASGWNKPINIPVFTSSGLVCAGREENIIDEIVIGIDVSGSVDDSMLKDMYHKTISVLGEVKFLTAHILLCDWMVHKAIRCENSNIDELHDALDGVGGGGTKFTPYFEWARTNAPNAPIVIMTDGECDDLYDLEDPHVPLLWLSWQEPVESYKVGEAIEIWS